MSTRTRVWLATAAAAALVGFATLAVLIAERAAIVTGPDHAVHAALIEFGSAHPSWVSAWHAITHLGDTLTISAIDTALLVACLFQRRWGLAALVPVLAIGGWAVRIGVRNLTARPRPADSFWPETGSSFPSGHTTNTALMVGLGIVVGWPHLRGPARGALIGGGATYALAVGFSRAAGGVHWPSDVVAGLLLAVALTCGAVAVWPWPITMVAPPRG